jgi:hypothetical protein
MTKLAIHPDHDAVFHAAALAAGASRAMLALILATPAGAPLDGQPTRRRQPASVTRVYRARDLPPVSTASGRPAQALPVAGKAGALRVDGVTRKPGTRNDTITVSVRTITPVPADVVHAASVKRAECLTRTGKPGTLADMSRKSSEIHAGTRGWSADVGASVPAPAVHVAPRTHGELVASGVVAACLPVSVSYVNLTRGMPGVVAYTFQGCASCAS